MASVSQSFSSPASKAPAVNTGWQRFVHWLVQRRVRISVVVFLALIVEDMLIGVRPHDLADFRDPHTNIGLGLLFLGLAVRSWAAGTLHKHSQLTMTGPYAMVRHPLYLGSFMMMVGLCTLIDDYENIFFVLGPFTLLYVFGVLHEERQLSQKFGEAWTQYVQMTPRFIPRRWPNNAFGTWTLNQWIRNREYQAVGAVILGLIALQAWKLYQLRG